MVPNFVIIVIKIKLNDALTVNIDAKNKAAPLYRGIREPTYIFNPIIKKTIGRLHLTLNSPSILNCRNRGERRKLLN